MGESSEHSLRPALEWKMQKNAHLVSNYDKNPQENVFYSAYYCMKLHEIYTLRRPNFEEKVIAKIL